MSEETAYVKPEDLLLGAWIVSTDENLLRKIEILK